MDIDDVKGITLMRDDCDKIYDLCTALYIILTNPEYDRYERSPHLILLTDIQDKIMQLESDLKNYWENMSK